MKRLTGSTLGILLICLSIAAREGGAAAAEPSGLSVTVTPSASTLLARDTVRGSITVKSAGASVSYASVVVTAKGPQTRSVRVRTDAHGRAPFSLSTLKPGHYQMLPATRDDSGSVSSQPVPIFVEDDHGVSIMLNAGQDTTFGTGETMWVRGRVVDSRNRAVRGRSVGI